jgi:hypothetical protein
MRIFKSVCILLSIVALTISCKTSDPKPSPRPAYSVPILYGSSAKVTIMAGYTSLGDPGNIDGNLTTARFGSLAGLAFDSQNNLFVVDRMYCTIRKITPSGDVTTFAGTGTNGHADGMGKKASFYGPNGIVIDPYDNLYIVDCGNNCIRKITPAGEVTTFAGSTNGIGGSDDGIGTAATFNGPIDLAMDVQGNLYVTESYKIRRITPAGLVTTLAGSDGNGYRDGTDTAAYFWGPTGIGVGLDGNIYVSDDNKLIRKITPFGVVSTFAGSYSASGYIDGIGTAARFATLDGMTIDASGNMYVTDGILIRKITPDAVVTMVAGGNGSPYIENGIGCASSFLYPSGITHDATGNLYVTELCLIRKITIQ